MQKMNLKAKLAKYKSYYQEMAAVLAIAGSYFVLHILKIGCPIKFFTGISCAGCGMTRAWMSVLKLDFAQAFYYHPLFWMVPIGALVLVGRNKMPKKVAGIILGGIVMVFVIVYIIRMINPNDTVVKIDFYESAIWHILRKAREII